MCTFSYGQGIKQNFTLNICKQPITATQVVSHHNDLSDMKKVRGGACPMSNDNLTGNIKFAILHSTLNHNIICGHNFRCRQVTATDRVALLVDSYHIYFSQESTCLETVHPQSNTKNHLLAIHVHQPSWNFLRLLLRCIYPLIVILQLVIKIRIMLKDQMSINLNICHFNAGKILRKY